MQQNNLVEEDLLMNLMKTTEEYTKGHKEPLTESEQLKEFESSTEEEEDGKSIANWTGIKRQNYRIRFSDITPLWRIPF